MDRPLVLPPAPLSAVDAHGAPRLGVYAGPIADAGLGSLAGPWHRGPLYRRMHGKSWRWGMVADERIMAVFCLVDVGYAANAFAFVVDLAERRMLVDRTALGMPWLVRVGETPNEGSDARFDGGGLHIRISRARGATAYGVTVRGKDLEIDAELDALDAPAELTLIAPIPGGPLNVTQKTTGLAARGTIRAAGTVHDLANGFGGFDYTNGLLARHTAWQWGFATGAVEGRAIGLNLVAGFNEAGAASENALWLDGSIVPVGRARFVFDPAKPLEPWHITTEDASVDLEFRPIGSHREDRNLVAARSHFVQAVGTFEGHVRHAGATIRVAGLPGVVEDQDVLW